MSGRSGPVNGHIRPIESGKGTSNATADAVAIAVAAAVAGLASVTPAAHADWSNLGYTAWSNGTSYFLGCQTYESGGYGPVYKSTIVGVNQTTTGKTMRMQVYRHGSQLVSR